MKKTIREYDVQHKKVIIRVDFNVPIKDGSILDDNRIIQSVETIQYAVDRGAKTILMSHLGRVKTEADKKDKSLRPIAKKLSTLLHKEVIFIDQTRGKKVEQAINTLLPGDILLLENTRFEDIDGKKESTNDPELGAYWASLGDIYINDAFGIAHRAHASNVGIASHLPSGMGFLLEKEIQILTKTIQNPQRPFTVILGGSKVSDKIGVLENIVHIADYILIGGGMAYTFLKAKEYPVGKSLLDEKYTSFCKNMLEKYPDKIIVPVDTANALESKESIPLIRNVKDTKPDEIGLDIGPRTVTLFKSYLDKSETILWNGPVGMFEIDAFSKGTKALCEIISTTKKTTIIGGGDTASAIIQMGYHDKVTHISTGGGASLELLEGKILPGIDVLEDV